MARFHGILVIYGLFLLRLKRKQGFDWMFQDSQPSYNVFFVHLVRVNYETSPIKHKPIPCTIPPAMVTSFWALGVIFIQTCLIFLAGVSENGVSGVYHPQNPGIFHKQLASNMALSETIVPIDPILAIYPIYPSKLQVKPPLLLAVSPCFTHIGCNDMCICIPSGYLT